MHPICPTESKSGSPSTRPRFSAFLTIQRQPTPSSSYIVLKGLPPAIGRFCRRLQDQRLALQKLEVFAIDSRFALSGLIFFTAYRASIAFGTQACARARIRIQEHESTDHEIPAHPFRQSSTRPINPKSLRYDVLICEGRIMVGSG